MLGKRYRLKLATWTVVREPGQPSPRRLNDPESVAALAQDLLSANDDEKEHFWVLLLSYAQRPRRGRGRRPFATRSA
jgi:hypothetical protein